MHDGGLIMNYLNIQNIGIFKIPYSVYCVKQFCDVHKINYIISKNKPAFGCRDAASKRRDGVKTGITLERELKTLLCECNLNSKSFIFAAHMSANKSACFKSIKRALGISKNSDITLASSLALGKLNMRLGTVNPFLLAVKTRQRIIQIFDSDLIECKTTIFTNAGDLTWGIEFDIIKLILNINNSIIYKITKDKREVLK